MDQFLLWGRFQSEFNLSQEKEEETLITEHETLGKKFKTPKRSKRSMEIPSSTEKSSKIITRSSRRKLFEEPREPSKQIHVIKEVYTIKKKKVERKEMVIG